MATRVQSVTLNLTPQLRAWLEERARENYRTLSAEVRCRLEGTVPLEQRQDALQPAMAAA